MTCIVAIADGNNVYIGGDRGHSDSSCIASSTRPKISKHGEYLMGYAGNAGIGQMVEYLFKFPAITNNDINKHMMTVFMPALRKFCTDNGYEPDKEENEADFIIAVRGRVYEINTGHMYCTEYDEIATGSGMGYAFGSMHTTKKADLPAKNRVELALEAAIHYSPSCQSPIDILYI